MLTRILLLIGLVEKIKSRRCAYPTGPQSTKATLQPADLWRKKDQYQRDLRDQLKSNITVMTTSIDVNETLCYIIEIPYYNNLLGVSSRDKYEYRITLAQIEEVYNIRSAYNFSIPLVRAACWCDCPGSTDTCNSGTNTCHGNDTETAETCVMFHAGNQNSKECPMRWGTSELCCMVRMQPVRSHYKVYTAISLDSPRYLATYQVDLVNTHTRQKMYSTRQKVDLTQSHRFLNMFPVLLHLASRPKPILQNRLYFLPTNVDSKQLYTNIKINQANEWSLSKIGWFKHDGKQYQINKALLRKAMSVTAEVCGKNEVKFNLNAKFVNHFPYTAYDILPTLRHQIYKFEKTKKYVSFNLRQFPRVDVVVTFAGINKIILKQDASYFASFTAQLIILPYASHVKIRFKNIAGSIEGVYLRRKNSQVVYRQYFFVYVSQNSSFIDKIVAVSEQECFLDKDTSRQVCVRPINKFSYECSPVSCIYDSVYPPWNKIKEPKQEFDVSVWNGTSRWLSYLKPWEWFDGINSWMEFCVMVCLISLLVICGIVIRSVVCSVRKRVRKRTN